MAGVVRSGLVLLLAGCLLGGSAVGMAAQPSDELEWEEAYTRGAFASLPIRNGFGFDALATLHLFRTGIGLMKDGCVWANPEWAAALSAAWSGSRLGRAQFSVNDRAEPVEATSRASQRWKGLEALYKGKPECRHLDAYLLGVEENLPDVALDLLGLPRGQSPYSDMSGNTLLRVKLGHAGPISGERAHLGQDTENGVRLAIEELNASRLRIRGKPVRFMLLSVDDAGQPANAVSVVNRMVDGKVRAVIGHLDSGVSVPASREYFRAGIPMVSPASTTPWLTRQRFGSVFRMLPDDERIGAGLARYAKGELGAASVAIVRDGTPYGDGLAWAFDAEASALGLQVTNREKTGDMARELAGVLERIKASSPDLVFFGGQDAVGGALLMQMRSMGIGAKLMGGDGICTDWFAELADKALGDDQVICAEAGGFDEGLEAGLAAFRNHYQARFGKETDVYGPYAYDAVMLVAQSMVAAQSSDPSIYLRQLRAADGFKGVTGRYRFDARGDPVEGRFTVYAFRERRKAVVKVVRLLPPPDAVRAIALGPR